ncbi:MAG: undecaprenyl-phosphate glucose phosphotransferase [Anaerolineales bacterium]|nr:undecaprenyl-phosphate glucose phosphotransferase [Anaerolineales bacterium]
MPRGSWKWLFVQVGADAALINLAIWIAWYIRYELELAPGTTGEGFFYHPYSAYAPLAAVLTILAIGIFRFEGLYAPRRGRSFSDELYTLLNGTTTATLLIMAITFFLRPLVFSRAMYVYAAMIIVILLSIERIVRRVAHARLRKRGIGVDRVLIVGAGEAGRALMRNIVAQPELAYQIVGFVDDDPEKNQIDIGRFKALGGTEQLPHVLKELAVNEVIVTLPWTARDKIVRILNLCQRYNVTAKLVPDLFQLSLSRVAIGDVGGIPLIAIREPQLGMVDAVVKRLMDLVFGSILFLVSAPLILVIVILIRLDSAGPILFAQKRIGRYGHEFVTFKFRSMHEGAEEEQSALNGLNEATGPLFKIRDDPRRTRVGRWLRRMSWDELPQLINVLRGEMSVVGPRPPTPNEVEQYQEWHKRRLDVRPGLTGLSQVSGRSELTFDETAMLDIYYIENWSPWMDVGIIFKTIPTVLLARGAY